MVLLRLRYGLMSCVDATVEPGVKHVNVGPALVDRELKEVPVVFVKGESMFMSEAKSQVLQFWATGYPARLENVLAAALKNWRISTSLPMIWRVRLIGTKMTERDVRLW